MGDGLKRAFAATAATRMHARGYVLLDRGDGLHWLRCVDCGREWAERDNGTVVKGSRSCRPSAACQRRRIAELESVLMTARSQIITLGGDARHADSDSIQQSVLDVIEAALKR